MPEDHNQPQQFGQSAAPNVPQMPPATPPVDFAASQMAAGVTTGQVVSPTAPTLAFNPVQPPSVSPNPVQPVVPSVSGSPFGAGTPAGYPVAPAGLPATQPNKQKKLLIVAIVALAAIILIGGVAMLLKLSSGVKYADVTAAHRTATTLGDDINAVSSAMNALDVTGGSSNVSSSVATINSKLTDAQKQFDMLKKSPVQRDKDVKQKFAAFDAKWAPFVTYIKNSSKDMQVVGPIMADFEDKLQVLLSKPPTTPAALTTYLTSYKALIDDANTKIATIHMNITENQQVVDELKSFLSASSTSISAAQHDLAANNMSAVNTDLLKVETSETSFVSKIGDIEDKINAKEDQLDPFDQFEAFDSQLYKLSQKLQK
jgi:hypothetical protein